jgi:hypothetical protein
VAEYVPDVGDIVWLQFDPQAGHEQAGHRPALVLTPARYNARHCVDFNACTLTPDSAGRGRARRPPGDVRQSLARQGSRRRPARLGEPGAEPFGESVLAQLTGREGFDGADRINLVEGQPPPVVGQEQAGHHPGRSLVPISKPAVSGEAEGVGRCERGRVGITVGGKVLRPRKSGLHRALIARTFEAAMLR